MPSPVPTLIGLTDQEREQLEAWARRRSSAQALALRSRIVLVAANGPNNTEIAGQLGIAGELGAEVAQPVCRASA